MEYYRSPHPYLEPVIYLGLKNYQYDLRHVEVHDTIATPEMWHHNRMGNFGGLYNRKNPFTLDDRHRPPTRKILILVLPILVSRV